jgi:23S rRNA pseudouridine1911/1915/1917 synthase
VTLDQREVGKSDRVVAGAWLEVSLPEQGNRGGELVAEPVPGMAVIHDDDDFVVVDKPVGVAAHPSVGWTGPTVIGGLAAAGYRISTSGAAERQGIVHRLDVGTSGLMVVAKSERAYTALKRAFKERTVDKTYHALVQGLPDPVQGTVDAPIGRHPGHDYKFAVLSGGKPSITHYEVIEAFRSASLLEIHLETGRTHQIRVHFSALRHPCAGDLTYGADPVLAARLGLRRQWLHAVGLGFEHPGTGAPVRFESPYPADLQIALDRVSA